MAIEYTWKEDNIRQKSVKVDMNWIKIDAIECFPLPPSSVF